MKNKTQMSRNERLVTRIEGCMDDLVDCFEEFVKKSMLVVSVAVGSLVLMVMYVVKMMTERAASRQIGGATTAAINRPITLMTATEFITNRSSQVTNQSTTEEESTNTCACNIDPSITNATDSKTTSVQDIPNCVDIYMKETESSMNSNPQYVSKQTQVSDDLKEARIETKSESAMQSFWSKHHLSSPRWSPKTKLVTSSCCSICCENDQTGQCKR